MLIVLGFRGVRMARILRAAAAVVVLAAAGGVLSASDRVAVYGKIDRVVLQPSAEAPDTIQVFGVFSVAVPKNMDDYQPARRGYLYYRLPSDKQTARREWNDLKQVAGTSQIVAFGLRWEGPPTLRPETDSPANPDPYTLNTGVVKVQGRTDYAPVRAIVQFKP
jgi:hypothetical protein